MKSLKASIKPFEAPQRSVKISVKKKRSVKIEIKLIFIFIQLSEMNGPGSVTW